GRLKITVNDAIQYLTKLDELGIFSYLPRKDKPQVIYLQNRLRKEELRLDIKAINARKEEYENRLKAVHNYITENDTCRTKLLVQYFGEKDNQDCGVCDVCLAKKKSGLTDEQFSKAVAEVEALLKAEPLGIDTLSMKLDLDGDNYNKVIDFLLDAGKLSRNKQKELVWVG
ncbi:MAG: RecQ family zinc-binding domain-containing protein, partial [Bacteroidetes bacterium]|nr:RecQ family zinc-binding domain-containing protein [Bacteroidota bacterium]